MTRSLSYPAPHELAVHAQTPDRHEDVDRGTLWTADEVAWLTANYHRFRSRVCAQLLRRSEMSVRVKIHRIRHGRTRSGNVSRKTAASTVAA